MKIFNYFLALCLFAIIIFVLFDKVVVIKLIAKESRCEPKIIYETVKPQEKELNVLIVSGHVENPKKASRADVRGAKSASGVYEYKFNDKIVSLFQQKKYQLPNVKYQTILATQNVSLRERVGFVNKILKPDLYIEIHQDSALFRDIKKAKKEGVNGKMWKLMTGYSVHISSKNKFYKQSLTFSKLLSKELSDKNFKPNIYHDGKNRFPTIDKKLGIYNRIRPYGIYILYFSQTPTVILECSTIINPKDEKMINIRSNQIKIINAINQAIKKYIKMG